MNAKGVLTTFFLCLSASCFFSTFLSPLCHQSQVIHVPIQLLHRKLSALGNFLHIAIRQNVVILYQVLKRFLDNNTWRLEHAATDTKFFNIVFVLFWSKEMSCTKSRAIITVATPGIGTGTYISGGPLSYHVESVTSLPHNGCRQPG